MTKKIEVFASEALPGELDAFPDIKRGWGTTKETTGGIPPMKWFNAIQKRTDEAINAIAEGSISGCTFKDGATLDSHNDLIYDDVSKSWYFWIGGNGKVIPPNSNASEIIESDGGIWSDTNPDGLWVDVGDMSLREELKNGDGSLIAVGNNSTLKDKLSEIKSVVDFGVKGDGSDESEKMQDAINSKMVRIPDGMKISLSSVSIPKGTEFHFGIGAEISLSSVNALTFEQDTRRYISTTIAKGEKSISYNGDALPTDLKYVKINRPWDASDAWYIANSENPDELGYTAELFEVESVMGNVINLRNPLPFLVNTESSVQVIEEKDTHFFGGTISMEYNGSERWSNTATYASNVYFHRTKFKFNNKGGLRFNACHRTIFNNTIGMDSGNGSNIMFAYGCTDSSVERCVFVGGKNADAQVITYAGCRRITSQSNLYIMETVSTIISGLYFGAKSIGCKSIDDTVIGGNYGISVMFGAQQFDIIRPNLQGQRNASLFIERCQMFSVSEPNVDYDGTGKSSSDDTWGAILIRDCDDYSLYNQGVPIRAIGRMFSIYASSGKGGVIRKNININLKGTGEARLSIPVMNSNITVKTDGKLSWYQGGNTTLNVGIIDCECSSILVSNILYSRIKRNNLVGNGTGIGIDITGASSSWNEIDDNQLVNFSQGISVPDSDLCKYTNNVGIDNKFRDVGVPVVIPTRSNSTPQIPYSANRPPVRGFMLSVNEMLNDSAIQRTAQGFRHSGLNSGKKSDWYRVNVSETRMED